MTDTPMGLSVEELAADGVTALPTLELRLDDTAAIAVAGNLNIAAPTAEPSPTASP